MLTSAGRSDPSSYLPVLKGSKFKPQMGPPRVGMKLGTEQDGGWDGALLASPSARPDQAAESAHSHRNKAGLVSSHESWRRTAQPSSVLPGCDSAISGKFCLAFPTAGPDSRKPRGGRTKAEKWATVTHSPCLHGDGASRLPPGWSSVTTALRPSPPSST